MDSKKLPQLQQATTHLGPQSLPQKRHPSSAFHASSSITALDSRPSHSPVCQNPAQFQGVPSNFSQLSLKHQQQQQQHSAATQQHHQHHQIYQTSAQLATFSDTNQSPLSSGHTHYSKSTYSKPSEGNQYPSEQMYQSSRERLYQQAPPRTHHPPSALISHQHPQPITALQQKYQQLQQAKLHAQLQTQNEAMVQQQRTFAMRQTVNPPLKQSQQHVHGHSSASTPSSQSQPSIHTQNRNIPPSTLNLTSQFQPAAGPLKINNLQHFHHDLHSQQQQQYIQQQKLQNQIIYQQNQQIQQQILHSKLQSTPVDNSPVYIQQNHPGHVVNQACQTQISGATNKNENVKSSPSSDDTKSPTHPPLDRKKSAGIIQALKSPVTKRPVSSPVTLSGWLYKQGSDGLKVWRKRWFVLSEYCLYYYRGPEEEKILGSILLPSYRVSACLPEDKVYRKYAFKCEHTNMRTYWLSAENSEMMGQWVRALTAASLMQASSESSDQTSQPSVSSLNQSGENSDSGIHTFQSQQSKLSIPQGPVTPASDSGGGPQPLYANAPPKPRRATDGGYSSPSPENSIERAETHHHQMSNIYGHRTEIKPRVTAIAHRQQAHQHQQHHVIYDSRTGNITSALKMGNSHNPTTIGDVKLAQQIHFDQNTKAPHQGTSRAQHTKSPFPLNTSEQYSAGKSSVNSNYGMHQQLNHQQILCDLSQGNDYDQQHIIKAPQRFNDEIHGEKEMYTQRLVQQNYGGGAAGIVGGGGVVNNMVAYPNAERRTPDTYGRSKSGQSRVFSDYEDIYNLGQQDVLQESHQGQHQLDLGSYRRPLSPPSYDNSKHIPQMPSRCTPTHLETNTQQVNMRLHPLSSSIHARPHSADFLEYEARAELAANFQPEPIPAPRPKSSLDINRNPDSFYYSEASYAEKMRQSALYLQKPSPTTTNNHIVQSQSSSNIYKPTVHEINSYAAGHHNSNTIAHESQYDRTRRKLLNEAISQSGAQSVPRIHLPLHNATFKLASYSSPTATATIQQNEQFLRSASARLPRKDDDLAVKDGERKREESMKRLLEWKQRMLQSPLTRKGQATAAAQAQQQQTGLSSVSKLPSSQNLILSPLHRTNCGGGAGGIQRSRSETNANTGYNSYSSDDEDGPPEQTPAGRSSSSTTTTTSTTTVTTTTPTPSTSSQISVRNRDQNTTVVSPTPSMNKPLKYLSEITKTPSITKLEDNSQSQSPKLQLSLSQVQAQDTRLDNVQNLNKLIVTVLQEATYVPVYKHKTVNQNLNNSASGGIHQVNNHDYQNMEIEKSPHETELLPEHEHPNKQKVSLQTQKDDAEDTNLDENSDTAESENENEQNFEYTDEDLDEALAKEEEKYGFIILSDIERISREKEENDQIYENEPITPTNQVIMESHYMPMTPKRSVLSPCSSITLTNTSTEETDENPYVEMTKNVTEEAKSNYEIVCIAASFQEDSEPVYMELSHARTLQDGVNIDKIISSGKSTIKKSALKKLDSAVKKKPKKNSERMVKRKDLPDILKASHNTIVDSDSSDADDESPKNQQANTKLRSRSRFSLSDTFRPASYYLGVSTPMANCAESSESEIVSPPPIPSSPPPLDEMNTEEIFSSENYDTVKRRDKLNLSFEKIPKIHSSDSSLILGKSTSEGLKSSRLSLPDQFTKLRSFKPPPSPKANERNLSDSNYSFNTDNSSNTSSDYDLYNKLKNSSPSFAATTSSGLYQLYQSNSSLPQKFTTDSSETESVELRSRNGNHLHHHQHHHQMSDSELERLRSRRPLSEESISEIESMSEHFEETLTTSELDSYLSQLQTSNLSLYQNTASEATTINWANNSDVITNFIKPPEVFRTNNDEHFYGNIHFVSSTDSIQKIGSNEVGDSRVQMLASVEQDIPTILSPLKEKNLSLHDAQCESEDLKTVGSTSIGIELATLSSVDLDQTSLCTAYDLTLLSPIHSRNNSNISDQSAPYYYADLASRTTPLNNQRDINFINRTGISHIHNPISGGSYRFNQGLADSRSQSVEILNIVTEKDKSINTKNLYKMKSSIEKNITKDLKYSNSKNNNNNSNNVKMVESRCHKLAYSSGSTSCTSNENSNTTTTSTTVLTPISSKMVAKNTNNNHDTTNNYSSPPPPVPVYPVSASVPKHVSIVNASPSSSTSTLSSVSVTGKQRNNVVEGIRRTDQIFSQRNDSQLSGISGATAGSALEGGEQLWEEDALWRESLRRVSQRHARSLDDLDRIVDQTTFVGVTTPNYRSKRFLETDQAWNVESSTHIKSAKLSRDVTYVNDNIVSPESRSNYRVRKSEPVMQIQSNAIVWNEEDKVNENDVYVQLAVDDNNSDVYETLRSHGTDSAYSRKSIEIDRETIRQWDSMSSGLMKTVGSSSNSTSKFPKKINNRRLSGGSETTASIPLTTSTTSFVSKYPIVEDPLTTPQPAKKANASAKSHRVP